MYASDLLKYCHTPPLPQQMPQQTPLPLPQTLFRFSPLDALAAVAHSSLNNSEPQQMPALPAPAARAHSSSVSSVSSASSGSSARSAKRKRSNLPKKATSVLMHWLQDNLSHPYPNAKEKTELLRKTGLTPQQLSNWFINARRRKMRSLSQSAGSTSSFSGSDSN